MGTRAAGAAAATWPAATIVANSSNILGTESENRGSNYNYF